MKISVAQTRPFKGDIGKNMEAHKKLIFHAVAKGAEAIFFPELSVTGYEPELAGSLVTDQEDSRFDDLQEISNTHSLTIGIGIPTHGVSAIHISMIIFQPHSPRQTYSKRYLHEDEFPYFVQGQTQVLLQVASYTLAPAICYESLLPEHAESAFSEGADIYVACVAKSQKGIEKAYKHYPEIAKKYKMPVLMANCVGFCDTFESAGKTAVWSKEGLLVGSLDGKSEGILTFDTETGEILELRM